MQNSPLISVILTSYNHADFIAYTIQSFLNQSFKNFELLIIDDRSSDNSVEIIKSFNDTRITLIELQENRGICYASNLGIAKAKGKYIKLFASDDIALPSLLEEQINFLEKHSNYDAVFSGIEVINDQGKILSRKTRRFEKFFTKKNRNKEEWMNHFFFKGNCLATPTMTARKELLEKIGGLDRRLSQAHDFDLWVKFCLHGSNIYVLPQKLVQYRKHLNNKNMSSNTSIVRARLIFDNEKILYNFLQIKDPLTLIKIFPNLKSIQNKINENTIAFLIANEAWQTKNHYHRQFSISVLYNFLENQKIMTELENQFNFKINKDFYEMVSSNPLGSSLETINEKPIYRRIIKSCGNIIFSKFFCR